MKTSLSVILLLVLQILSAQATKPFVLGEICEIESTILAEKRILNIYLPEGYKPNDTITYPVIYLLDGSADEDFIHIAGLVQYCNFSWVNLLPKSILVGIANVDRRRDFSFPTSVEKVKKDFPTTGQSEKFINFIEKELQPYIEKQYHTNSTKTIIGQSFGGLLATEILFKRPKLFTQYIIISPSLWWDNESLLKVDMKSCDRPISVYLAVGMEGKVMIDDSKELLRLLNIDKNKNIKSSYRFFGDEDHATIFHLAVYDAFKTLNQKK